jgi:hypothetical protein
MPEMFYDVHLTDKLPVAPGIALSFCENRRTCECRSRRLFEDAEENVAAQKAKPNLYRVRKIKTATKNGSEWFRRSGNIMDDLSGRAVLGEEELPIPSEL